MIQDWAKKPGWPLLIILSSIPVLMWLVSMPLSDRVGNSYILLTSIGSLAGICAVVLYCFNVILSTRIKALENLFGGLNKMYIAHHIVGGLSLCFALLHSLALTFRWSSISLRQAALFGLPTTDDWPKTFGVLALWLFVVLMILTFYIKLPYKIWLLTHKYLGLSLLLIALHILFISGNISVNRPLKIYLVTLVLLAIVSFIYRTLLPRFLVRRYKYTIAEVKPMSDGVVRITMTPKDGRLDFKSGQFIFVSFRVTEFSREWHPFTISSNTSENGLSITVKGLGKYTSSLVKLAPGMVGGDVWLEGAYGNFSFNNFRSNRQVWIAGGIGITPFLSMVADVKPPYKVDLYYSVKNQAEIIDALTLHNWEKNSQGALKIIPVIVDRDGLLTAEKIAKTSGNIADAEILLCGPPPMMKALRQQLRTQNVKDAKIHSEEFSMS